jgi:hypothetical protein
MLSTIEKAQDHLEQKGIDTVIENDTLYVCIGDVKLELSDFEINYQADEYDSYMIAGIEGIEILSVDLTFYQKVDRDLYDFGSLYLECEGREFVFDVCKTSLGDDGTSIVCELEVDLDTTPKTYVKNEQYDGSNLYDLTKNDFFNPNLVAKMYIGNEYEIEPEAISLFFRAGGLTSVVNVLNE